VVSPNYIATILQDPSNATAFTITPIPESTVQALKESSGGSDGTVDESNPTPPSRPNDLNIVGTGPVDMDLEDGKLDETMDQLCVLGVTQLPKGGTCEAPKAAE
jgi:hypothetical protein